jgi:hypothetical protein
MKKWTVLFAVSLSMLAHGADEGWRNVCETRTLPRPVKGIWSAPIEKGASAFSVDWRDGATGTVSFVHTERGHFISIAKTTPVGYVVVTAKEAFSVPSGTKLRAYAGCESDNADCEYSYGFYGCHIWLQCKYRSKVQKKETRAKSRCLFVIGFVSNRIFNLSIGRCLVP